MSHTNWDLNKLYIALIYCLLYEYLMRIVYSRQIILHPNKNNILLYWHIRFTYSNI